MLPLTVPGTGTVFAQQNTIPDYETARRLFWAELYPDGGQTLYCKQSFSGSYQRGINIEHVFPMSWVTRALDCGRRQQCRRSSRQFNHIEADLHNLYPSRKDLNDERGSLPYALIKGEARRFGKCDFEVDSKRRVIEPRNGARGEIARAMFYMANAYDLKLYKRQREMLKQWNKQDMPSREEKRRNDIIEKLQGNRNPYIDRPQLANEFE